MSDTILVFLRIGELKYIKELYEKGTVYMNTIEHFKKISDDGLRGDENEGAIDLIRPENATIRFSFMDRDIKPASLSYGTSAKGINLYCLYSISSRWFPNPNDFKLDERNVDFGSHFLVIKQPGVFIEKVANELTKRGYAFEHGFVNYYEDKEQLRDLTPFCKSNKYEYQKEFRFVVENETNEPIIINIGSMESYAEIFETKELAGIELVKK